MLELIESYIKEYHIPMFEIRAADFIGIIGENGSIKSLKNRIGTEELVVYNSYSSLTGCWEQYCQKHDLELPTVIKVYGKGNYPWGEKYVFFENNDLIMFTRFAQV